MIKAHLYEAKVWALCYGVQPIQYRPYTIGVTHSNKLAALIFQINHIKFIPVTMEQRIFETHLLIQEICCST